MASGFKTVRDDCVEYFLYFTDVNCEDCPEETENALMSKCLDVKMFLSQYIDEYIWHKDSFNVLPQCISSCEDSKSKEIVPPHLYGITEYADNIEDEWFIVFLLLELSKYFEDLVVRVVDSDGEFLLIEAAEVLPSWATPEVCDGRVYIYRGAVHIIPIDKERVIPCPEVAVKLIRKDPSHTRANDAVQTAIEGRIKGYPGKTKDNLHQAQVYIPVGVAALLKARPSLISSAVLAFCNKDPTNIKACNAMRFFPPENRVMRNVVFTKCLYAMLMHDKYRPDKRTGWNLPPESSPLYKSHSLGMKLACGFEIIITQAKANNTSTTTTTNDLSLSDRLWPKYLESLKHKGYFKDNLEGSKEYSALLEKAKAYFANDNTICEAESGDRKILALFDSLEYNTETFQKEESSLTVADDDSWLQICPQELDEMLEKRYGRKSTRNENSSVGVDIPSQLSTFLNHVSDLAGAEYPSDATPPIRPKRGVKNHKPKPSAKDPQVAMEEDGTTDVGNRIIFEPEAFSCAVQNILDFAVPEDSWDLESDGSSMSSYEDENDMDIEQLKGGKDLEKAPKSELKQYMDQMDQELAATTIGKSFEKASTSKEKQAGIKKDSKVEDNFDDIEDFRPVDIDLNAIKNILDSYQAQLGAPGPAENILGPMGVTMECVGRDEGK